MAKSKYHNFTDFSVILLQVTTRPKCDEIKDTVQQL
jgi:hypothetical protein